MKIRATTENDISAIEEIYVSAKRFMRESGNANQWNDDYPNGETAIADMRDGIGYVCQADDGEVVAVFAFAVGNDKTYEKIYNGKWLNDKPYAFIHRIAVKKHGQGIVDFCFNECYKIYPNLKIDTHADNIPMQKVLARNGFMRCGIIYLENGDERIAFQKV